MFAVARAPLRVSLFGGGTDRSEYYAAQCELPGRVLSFAIDKYMNVSVNKVDSHKKLKLMYSKIEEVSKSSLHKLDHDIVRALWSTYSCLDFGYEIGSFADVPTVGTGLGSSSSFTVALLTALQADPSVKYQFNLFSPLDFGHMASTIEIVFAGSPIGKQDQYAAALGGMNLLTFNEDESVDHLPLHPKKEFFGNLMLFYTGIKRNTNEVLSSQKVDFGTLDKMAAQAHDMAIAYMQGHYDEIGNELDLAWQLKKSLGGVSSPELDLIYEKAKSAGALGGKLLGAGMGGYFLFYVEPRYQSTVREALLPLTETVFSIDEEGAKLLYKG